MTKRRTSLRLALVVEEETDDPAPPSFDFDVAGEALDELSAIKPALAKATPNKAPPFLRKAGGR